MEFTTSSKYEDCFVAYLDILGFSEMVNNSENVDKIMEIFETLTASEKGVEIALTRAVIPEEKSRDRKSVEMNEAINEISFYIMSDSIIVSIPSNITYAFAALIEACRLVQCELYNLDPPVLLRGAITKGKFFKSERIAFGKAMVEAYLSQEYYSKYPRIIISGALANAFLNEMQISEMLYRDKNDQYFYIDCMKEHIGGLEVEDAEIVRFINFIEEHLGKYEDLKIREKYIWLKKDFERAMILVINHYFENIEWNVTGFDAMEEYFKIVEKNKDN